MTEAGTPALRLGGFQAFSTTDWPDRLVAVAFVQGCPWRCGYCHNAGLQSRAPQAGAPDWPAALALLRRRVGLLDGVVFSGGEPLLDPALPAAVAEVRALGFDVGLHTAGIYPEKLAALLPALAWVGLDLKAPPEQHEAVTGVAGGWHAADRALALLAGSTVPFEVRSTGDSHWLGTPALMAMAGQLHRHGVRRWVLQRCRSAGGPVADARPWPDDEARATLAAQGLDLLVR